MTKSFGQYLANLSDSGILTSEDLVNVLPVLLEANGKGLMQVTALVGNINQPSSMKGTYILSVSAVMDLKEGNKRSTKKKSKKGTAKAHGKNLSSRAVKSVKGVKWT
jgi:hypothetical protein